MAINAELEGVILIDNIIVSEELVREAFVCNLNACQGACCVEGDGGAPLTGEERLLLEDVYQEAKAYLTPEGRAAIQDQGKAVYDGEDWTTPMIGHNGPCAYVNYENGVAVCGIERAWQAGATAFRKPISCHLYPLREVQRENVTVLYYHKWHICAPACANGDKLGVRVYQFLKEAIIRRYGAEFYAQLDAAAARYATSAE